MTISWNDISALAGVVSAVIAAVALFISVRTQNSMRTNERRQATILAFQSIQENVLDKLIGIDRTNATTIVENLQLDDCKKAYDGYRVLLARLEHFSVGVNEGVYDFDIVDQLGGEHLIYLHKRVEPIIEKANRNHHDTGRFSAFVQLVERLKKKHNVN